MYVNRIYGKMHVMRRITSGICRRGRGFWSQNHVRSGFVRCVYLEARIAFDVLDFDFYSGLGGSTHEVLLDARGPRVTQSEGFMFGSKNKRQYNLQSKVQYSSE